jgi:hypothetical protein
MVTLGVLLNQLFDRVSQVIQQFQNAGLILEVNGGAQIQNLIDQAREALKDTLDTAASDLSSQQQQLVSGISGLIDDLQNKIIDDITAKTQLIANTLPFASNFPQVGSFTGNVLAQHVGGTLTFTVNGNFVDIGEDGYDAELMVNGATVINAAKTTLTISFQIDRNAFVFSDSQIKYVPFTVSIPYKVSELLGIIHKKEMATFIFIFIVLPTAPGYIILQTTQLVEVRQQIQDTCNGLVWDSSDDDVDLVQGCNMSDNWQCMRETVTYSFTRREGDSGSDWFDLGNASTSTFAGWHFKTEHHGLGTSGKLTVNLSYSKYKNVQQEQTTNSDNMPINWGDSKVLTVSPTASWKLIFHQFDGTVKEYAASDSSNPYMTIATAGNEISIKVIPQ